MPQSYVKNLLHCVFSTTGRQPLLHPDLQVRLFPYIGGIARDKGMNVLAIGGTEDHIHVLLRLPATLSIAKGIQEIKGISSRWVHETFPEHRSFAWQNGYGAFSIETS